MKENENNSGRMNPIQRDDAARILPMRCLLYPTRLLRSERTTEPLEPKAMDRIAAKVRERWVGS